MVIEEEQITNDYVIRHSGVKGQKKGIRNHQSYQVNPTRSGMVGEERGDAAEQSARLSKNHDRWAKNEKSLFKHKDEYSVEEFENRLNSLKRKYAKNPKKLYKHRGLYSNKELVKHMERLGLESSVKRLANDDSPAAIKKGRQILRDIAGDLATGVSIYGVTAAATNAIAGKEVLPYLKFGKKGKGGK